MIKKQRETEKASLKGGIKTILNSMRGAMVFLNKAAPSSVFIWSQQIKFLRCLPPTWGREGSSRLPGWILAARASVNKGNKLQLHLPQGLKGSLHIKHSSSLIWKGAIRLALGRGRERSLSRVGTIAQREEKDCEVILSFSLLCSSCHSLLQVIISYTGSETNNKRLGPHTNTHLLNSTSKSHTIWEDSTISLGGIFLP